MTPEIDLISDYVRILTYELTANGFPVPRNSDPHQVWVWYENLLRRIIEPIPREIKYAGGFSCASELADGLSLIETKIRNGDSLTPHPRLVAALCFARGQLAVDPARPEALDFRKKPAPHLAGNRSPERGSSFRRLFGSSQKRPAAPGLRRSNLSGIKRTGSAGAQTRSRSTYSLSGSATGRTVSGTALSKRKNQRSRAAIQGGPLISHRGGVHLTVTFKSQQLITS